MAMTQSVASFEKRLSVSALAPAGCRAPEDQQWRQSAEPGTAGKGVQSLRIEQQARAMFLKVWLCRA
jgi:hypothetical protein